MDEWSILDTYFKDTKYPFTKHHLDSYRQFLKTYIPNTIKSYNPITMVKLDPVTNSETLRVEINVGYNEEGNTDGIYLDRPTIIDSKGTPVLLTPHDARLRDLTYATKLYVDVEVTYYKDGELYHKVYFPHTLIGAIPLMLHSDQCMLQGQGAKVLKTFNECPLDPGGYFIIDGKEKVIISQERITTNRLFITTFEQSKEKDFSHRAYIRCTGDTGETVLSPRTVEFKIIRKSCYEHKDKCFTEPVKEEFQERQGAILVSLPSVRGYIPLTWAFRALGVESDKAIVECIFGNSDNLNPLLIDFIRPSLIDKGDYAKPLYTTLEVYEQLKNRVQYASTKHLKTIIVQDIFPNIETIPEKAKYLGYLIQQLAKTALNILPDSDRDSYAFKRVDISGFLLGQLFQETYSKFRKYVRDMIDQEYFYGVWKNTGQIELLLRKDNIHRILTPVIITEIFNRSLKGMWGPKTDDPDQGLVQDLARISYIGFLSHLRRCNMPLDRSIKVVDPHRLHAQQWGIMCPFESPDGASIGYLKNFALMTQITFGTDKNKLYKLFDELDIIPIKDVNNKISGNWNTIRVLVNGTYYGITLNPQRVVKIMRLYRRNGLINPFISIAWNIKDNEIRIQTEAGRPCRPLLILENGKMRLDSDSPKSWYPLVFGTFLSADKINDNKYYDETYISPYTIPTLMNKSEDDIVATLEKSAAAIEYVDIEEENTLYIAMKRENITQYHTHVEIHPSTIFSIVTSIIPLANTNAGPRLVFHGSQSKQAIGVYTTNFNKRFDTTGYILHYPQRRIIDTRPSHYIGNNIMPNGTQVIVAIATYSGYNQEDSVIINKSAIDRGLYVLTAYKTMKAAEKVISPDEHIEFANPIKLRNEGVPIEDIKFANYELLDENGIVKQDSYIPKGQQASIIGMVHVKKQVKEVNKGVLVQKVVEKQYRDVTLCSDISHYGKIDAVFIDNPTNGNNNRIAKVRFRKIRRPQLGDKNCLTPDHEVLTLNGWKLIENITKDDDVYVLKEDGTFGYENPIKLYKVECTDTQLYDLNSENVDLTTTLDHNMWVKKENSSKYEFIEARNVYKTNVSYQKYAKNNNKDYQIYLADNVVSMEYFLELFGYWIANGWGINNFEVMQSNKNRFLEVCSQLGFIARLKDITIEGSYIIDNKDLATFLGSYKNEKYLPDWVWKLSTVQCRYLYNGIFKGHDTYLTDSYRLSNDLQRLALHAEWSANILKYNYVYEVKVIKSETNSLSSEHMINYTGNVYCIEVPSHIFYVRKNLKPVWTGNCSSFAQKGVIGMILPEENMPFTKDGIRPDIIINPHAIPSRMTIGHLIETILSKTCCLEGCYGDGTVFIPFDKDEMYNDLASHNYEKYGNEILYDGRSGRQIATEIFLGPIYYYRLKHMVDDKIQARGTGSKVLLTQQPTAGRSKGGGLRVGEMERDVLLSYGISQFSKECGMDKSDKYRMAVCRECGILAKYKRRDNFGNLEIAGCMVCKSQDVSIIETPYAFKLLQQELEGLGVSMKLYTESIKEEESDSDSDSESDSSSSSSEEEKQEEPEPEPESESEIEEQDGGKNTLEEDEEKNVATFSDQENSDEIFIGGDEIELMEPDNTLLVGGNESFVNDVITNNETIQIQESMTEQPAPVIHQPENVVDIKTPQPSETDGGNNDVKTVYFDYDFQQDKEFYS